MSLSPIFCSASNIRYEWVVQLYLFVSWKPVRQKLHSFSRQPLTQLDHPHGKSFSLHPVWTFFVSIYEHCLMSSPHASQYRAWLHLLSDVLKKKECCCLIPLKLPVSQAKQTYLSQPLLTGWVFQLPDHLGSPSPTSLLFINVFPVLRVPKLGTALWMRSNEQQVERNNHFLLSADYVPSHRVQDVVASLFFRLRESGLWRARGKGRGKGEKAPVKP